MVRRDCDTSASSRSDTTSPSTRALLRPWWVSLRDRASSPQKPLTSRSFSPLRISSALAREPSSSPSASTMMLLPAPVSPVNAEKPPRKFEFERLDGGEVANLQAGEVGGRALRARSAV